MCRSAESSARRDSPPHLARCSSFGESRMGRRCRLPGGLIILLCAIAVAQAQQSSSCLTGVDSTASTPLGDKTKRASCSPKTSHGFPIPDSACTPGAINPTVTLTVLKSGNFKTGCERNKASSAKQKNATYDEYK